jgi:hypothetical protein
MPALRAGQRRLPAGAVSRSDVRLRVHERGAGETLACGTGACAAVVAGIRLGWLDAAVEVHARGGDLRVEWAGGDARADDRPGRNRFPRRDRTVSSSNHGPTQGVQGITEADIANYLANTPASSSAMPNCCPACS